MNEHADEGGWYHGRVDGDAAWAYAQATLDPNSYIVSDLVPPMFTVVPIRVAYLDLRRNTMRAESIRNVRAGVHGSHEVRWHAPIHAGMRIKWRAELYNQKQLRVGVASIAKIDVCDEDGQLLVEHFWGSLGVGGETDEVYGPDDQDTSFPETARQRPLGSHTFEVMRDQGFRYAGVSEDFNPHIIDDEAAHADGFPSKIVQGLCTFAMCSSALVKLAADGDPNRLRRVVGRMTAPLFPGHPMAVEIYDAGVGESGQQQIAFEAIQNGKIVIRHGFAEIG